MFGENIWPFLVSLVALVVVAFAPDQWGKKFYDALEGIFLTAGRAVMFVSSWVESLDHKCEEAFMGVTLTRMAVIGTLVAISTSALVYLFVPTK